MKRNLTGRVIPAALALALAAAPVTSFAKTKVVEATGVADENGFVSQPGNEYDDATMKKLADNVLEYDEIGKLVEVYSPTFKTLKETYSDKKDASKDVAKLKSQLSDKSASILDAADQMNGMTDQMKDLIGMLPTAPTTYAQLVYNSELLDYQAEQVLLMGDSLTQISPEQMHIKVIDANRAALEAGAQSAMIGYKQLKLNEESLESGLTLLAAVYQSTQNQAANGLATQSQVLSARQQLESTQATKLTLTANEQKLRQTLCTMLGWKYDAVPEIRDVPAADLARIDGMNPEKDKQAAQDNNFTIRYNVLDLDNKDAGSVEYQNLQRTIKQEKEEVSSSLVNLYNDVLQKRNELQTAKAAYELEKTKMETAERKWQLGTIGRLEYMQQQNALKTKEIAVKTGDLALFQAMETYDWAVKGNLKLSQ